MPELLNDRKKFMEVVNRALKIKELKKSELEEIKNIKTLLKNIDELNASEVQKKILSTSFIEKRDFIVERLVNKILNRNFIQSSIFSKKIKPFPEDEGRKLASLIRQKFSISKRRIRVYLLLRL